MAILTPKVIITYQGKECTSDFAPILRSVSFKDTLDGRAGQAEIALSNANRSFLGEWYPEVDHTIRLAMGYAGGELIDGGEFWVDEVSLAGSSSGDDCTIRALSLKSANLNAPVSKKYHAARPLAEVIGSVASELGCTVEGELSGSWSGLQNEPPMPFLARVARETGRIFKVEGQKLIFYPIAQLAATSQLVIQRADVRSYDIKDVAAGRIAKCTVKWWDATKKKEIAGSHTLQIAGGGQAVVWQEVKTSAEARQKAKDFLSERNKSGVEFSMELLGDVRLRAGVGVAVEGFGRFDATYFISEATHSFSNSGYTTSIVLQTKQ